MFILTLLNNNCIVTVLKSRLNKVYTCAQESNYLLVTKIPAVSVHLELVKLFKIYGDIEDYKMLDDYPSEEFTDTMLIKFVKIQIARLFQN